VTDRTGITQKMVGVDVTFI